MNPAVSFRTLLILGRVSNLPTIWSNCLAGWLLGGGGNLWRLPPLLLGASLIYTAGMFLNDACDENFDRQRRAERPIPSGKISARQVWQFGFAQLGLGVLFLCFCGKVAAVAAILLALTVLLYDFTHKFLTASPWLMGACRFWVYVIAGATGKDGLNGWAIGGGLALAFYIVGLSCVAKRESFRGPISLWPLLFLAAPVGLAFLINTGIYLTPAIPVAIFLALWILNCVRNLFFGGELNVGWTVTNLLAGVVFVDWLAVVPQINLWQCALFLVLFALTKFFQTFVPAT